MITSSEACKHHDELIIKKGHHLAQLQSGTPFCENQDFVYSTDQDVKESSILFESSPEKKAETIGWPINFLQDSLKSALNIQERHPTNPHVINNIGLEYLRLGKIEDALSFFNRVLEIDSEHFSAKANIAKCYVLLGEVKKAVTIYKCLEKRNGGDFKVLNNIAHLYFRQKKFDSALEYFQKAQEVNPKNHIVLNNIGLIYLTKNDVRKAISKIRQALKICNNDHHVYNNLGTCFVVSGDINKALRYFKIAYSINNSNRDILSNLSNAYQQIGEHEKAIQILNPFLIENPNDADLGNLLALSLFKTKQYVKSLSLLFKLIKNVDNDPRLLASLLNNIGAVYLHLGEESEGEKHITRSLEVYEKADINIYCNIIEFYFKKFRLEEAKEKIDLGLSFYPDNLILQFYLSEYYAKEEDYSSAEGILCDLLEKDKNFLLPYLALSSIYIEIYDDSERAIRLLDRVLEFHGDDILLTMIPIFSWIYKYQ